MGLDRIKICEIRQAFFMKNYTKLGQKGSRLYIWIVLNLARNGDQKEVPNWGEKGVKLEISLYPLLYEQDFLLLLTYPKFLQRPLCLYN